MLHVFHLVGGFGCEYANFLEVKEEIIAPKFRKGLQDQTVKPGVTVKMEVEVEGKPKSVKW